METQYVLAWTPDVASLSEGLLAARLVLGLSMAAHGAQKLFGWFNGPGIAGTAGFIEKLGFRPARLFATVAAVAEFTSGLLVALGLFGAIGPALMIAVMVVAMGRVHLPYGFFAMNNGIEVPLLYAAGAVALALTGPGAFSADTLLGLEWLWTPRVTWAALAVGTLGGVANLAICRTVPQPAPER